MSGSIDVSNPTVVQDSVKEYYGKVLAGTKDLKTSVCTIGKTKIPKHVREALKNVHEGVTSKYYGCGTVVPEALEGMSVLDLGSGSGQDCYVLSKLVGEKGNVVGLDMTDEQLSVANDYIQYHTELYGYAKSNIRFVKGYIERLGEAGLESNSFDLIVSNCVVNLSPDKRAVLEEAYRVLKVGGELYFSDVYADRDLPEKIRKHEVLWGECVAGALHWEELMRLAKEIGFAPPLIVTAFTYNLGNKELEEVVGDAKFASVTYRLFKPPAEAQPCFKVIYEGSVTGYEDNLTLDHYNTFKVGEVVIVDSNVATILKTSRFRKDFTFQSCAEGSSCGPQQREMNPFKIAENLGASASCGSSCDPKESGESSCGPKESSGSGCGAAKSSDGGCPPKSSGKCC